MHRPSCCTNTFAFIRRWGIAENGWPKWDRRHSGSCHRWHAIRLVMSEMKASPADNIVQTCPAAIRPFEVVKFSMNLDSIHHNTSGILHRPCFHTAPGSHGSAPPSPAPATRQGPGCSTETEPGKQRLRCGIAAGL